MYSNVNAPFGENVPHMMPQMSYGYCNYGHGNNDFVLIVVLFILLIIIGACAFNGYKG